MIRAQGHSPLLPHPVHTPCPLDPLAAPQQIPPMGTPPRTITPHQDTLGGNTLPSLCPSSPPLPSPLPPTGHPSLAVTPWQPLTPSKPPCQWSQGWGEHPLLTCRDLGWLQPEQVPLRAVTQRKSLSPSPPTLTVQERTPTLFLLPWLLYGFRA